MAKKRRKTKKTEEIKKKRGREIGGLTLLFLAILLLVSLSYIFGFYGENNTSVSFALFPYKNLLGPLGYFLSYIILQTFGTILSFVVSILMGWLGFHLIMDKNREYLIRKIVFFTLVIVFFDIIFSIPTLNIEKNISFIEGGGFIGHFIVEKGFKPLFGYNTFGAYLSMIFLLSIWIIIGTSWSFKILFLNSGNYISNILLKLKHIILKFYYFLKNGSFTIGKWLASKNYTKKVLNKEKLELNYSPTTDISEAYGENNLEKFEEIIDKLEKQKDVIDGEIIVEDNEIPKEETIDNDTDIIDDLFSINTEDNSNINQDDIIVNTVDNESNQPIEIDRNLNTSNNSENIENLNENIDYSNFNETDDIEKDTFKLPPIDILNSPPKSTIDRREELRSKGQQLLTKLSHFKIEGEIINVVSGPVITRFEIKLAPNIKVSKVAGLADDLAMALSAQSIRIQAPIPGKNTIGIEVPNAKREIVYFRDLIDSEQFQNSKYEIPFAIGHDVEGKPMITGLEEMPHLLIAGQTGAGKSVGLNTLIMSILYSKKPEECKLILIDPKKVEFSIYKKIPYLLTPVVTEAEDALAALNWITDEMDNRYRILSKVGVRNIKGFNKKAKEKKIPVSPDIPNKYLNGMHYIVLVIDELADLMLLAGKDVEALIQRIAQLARAVGIHLVVATQRPSVNVITGVIKANLPSRIAFKTPTVIDSRTILDSPGAERLLGRGDMLFYKTGALSGTIRLHGAFISDEEAEKITNFVEKQAGDQFTIEEIPDEFKKRAKDSTSKSTSSISADDDYDELLREAAKLVIDIGEASATMLQRRLKVGFARAARIIDQLELVGVVGESRGSKAREVLVDKTFIDSEEWNNIFL